MRAFTMLGCLIDAVISFNAHASYKYAQGMG